jgi:hypothetical protein
MAIEASFLDLGPVFLKLRNLKQRQRTLGTIESPGYKSAAFLFFYKPDESLKTFAIP